MMDYQDQKTIFCLRKIWVLLLLYFERNVLKYHFAAIISRPFNFAFGLAISFGHQENKAYPQNVSEPNQQKIS